MIVKSKAIFIFFMVLSFGIFSTSSDQTKKISEIEGPFLGQNHPKTSPVMFAPGIISTSKSEQNAMFSPDGKEFYFTRVLSGFRFVSYMMQLNGKVWTKPVMTSFYKSHEGGEPFITPDGQKLFFVARQNQKREKTKTGDIWVMKKTNNQWSKPLYIGSPVNSDFHEGYPTTTREGNLYFFSNQLGSIGGFDIFVSEIVNGEYTTPKNLGKPVNSPYNEFNPCIAPDESYLIFNSSNRPEGMGQQDLYISFQNNKGDWSRPRNLGKEINTEYNDYSAFVTADGKYLFFSSNRMMKESSGYRVDIFWVDGEIIEKFRPNQ